MKKIPFKVWVFIMPLLPFVLPHRAVCQNVLTLTDTLTGTQNDSACIINSTQVLVSGSVSNYTASEVITMKPGFHAIAGTEFHASIGGVCESNVDIVWEELRSNVFIDFEENTYKKAYDNPTLFYESCNLLPATQDGWVKFKLLEDYRTNGDWIYVGLIDNERLVGPQGTQNANFLIGVRADIHFTNPNMDNVILLQDGENPIDDMEGGESGDVYMVERAGGVVKYYRNGDPIYTHDWQCDTCSQVNPNSLDLQAIFYIYDTGPNLYNKVEITTSFACDSLILRYEKEDASQDSLGSIALVPQGGYPPYSIFWENPAYQGLSLENLKAGSYKVTVVDNQGNIASEDIRIYKEADIIWQVVPDSVGVVGDTYTSINSVVADSNATSRIFLSSNVLATQGNGKIIITLLQNEIPTGKNFSIGLRNIFKKNELNDGYGFYGLEFHEFGVTIKRDTLSFGEGSPPHPLVSGGNFVIDKFDVQKNLLGFVYEIELYEGDIIIYKNGKELYRESYPFESIELVRADAIFTKTPPQGHLVDIKVSFPPLSDVNMYHKLKKRLDGGFAVVRDKKLRFKYEEEYDTGNDKNDELTYTIYDWRHEPVTTGVSAISPSNKRLGFNWFILPVNLTHKEFYILEVKDAKGEKSYLRFQFICPSRNHLDCGILEYPIAVDDE